MNCMKLDYQAIGRQIRRLRKKHGWTQQRLAELAGQEPSNISHIERGATKLGLPTLVSIANALGVTADNLLYESLEKSRPFFEQEIADMLLDCSDEEIRLFFYTIKSLKESLRTCGYYASKP